MIEREIIHPPRVNFRDYQKPLIRYLRNGGKRAVAVWHRRAGKDMTALEWTREAAHRRVGVYWHMLPTLRQGRKVMWEGMDNDGKRMLDAWDGWRTPGAPESLVEHIRHDEMKVELRNGSIWYVVGSDNYDALVGTNPVGVVFSEWPLTDPNAWDYIRPILAANGGWALFIYTPRGRNHGYSLLQNARKAGDWFAEVLTVDSTNAVPKAAIEADRASGMPEEMVLQEYWCSFDAPLTGSYWGDQLMDAQREGRITRVQHDPALTVETWWDLGHSDATAVWFVQHAANEIHVIDYHEANGQPLDYYAKMLVEKREQKKFLYSRHLWPHDGGAKTLASGGRPLNSMMGDLGFSPEVQPRTDVLVGIQRVRQILPRCWFDEEHTLAGLDALRAYRKDEDEERSTEGRPFYKPTPRHDWASHGADAFRTGAMTTHDPNASRVKPRDRYAGSSGSSNRSSWAA